MAETLGFSVRIFMPTGEPEGLRVIEKSNWTGQGIFFPRSLYLNVRNRAELARTGIYILWGPSESGQLTRAYVGEGDALRIRFDRHFKEKEFWTHGVAFTSKDQNLNKAHIQYIEAKLVKLAADVKRCELDNGTTPQPSSLSEADRTDAELFLADILLCLPVLGVTFFEMPRAETLSIRRLFLNGKGIEAEGHEDPSGFVVRAGSKAVVDEAPSINHNLNLLRTTLKSNGILVPEDKVLNLTQDYVFSSPSNASSVLLGVNSNGLAEWKDASGRTLKSIQDAVIGESG